MKKLILLLSILFISAICTAQEPVVYYSDWLESIDNNSGLGYWTYCNSETEIYPVGTFCEEDYQLAYMNPGMHGHIGEVGSSGGGFCSGSELFCKDFESGVSDWSYTPAAEDCDGYDAAGDWCDQDTNAPNPLLGSYGFGIMGNEFVYGELSVPSDEFYVEFTFRTTDNTSIVFLRMQNDTQSESVNLLYLTGDGSLFIYWDNSGKSADTSDSLAADTTYHIGYYYKVEVGGADDGIIRFWINQDGSDFDAGDLVYNNTAVDTGDSFAAERIGLKAGDAVGIAYFDNIQVVSGSPSWPTS